MKRYKFTGRSTSGIKKYKADGESMMDLYYDLETQGVIGFEAFENYLLKVNGKTLEDMFLDGEWSDEVYEEFRENHDITEDQYRELIESENGNAYYQNFYEWNGEEYVQI